MRFKKFSLAWFLIGLGSNLQIISSLSMTEAAVLVCGPFWLFSELPHMRKDGAFVFFYLSFLLVLGCAVSCIANHSPFAGVLRGFSMTTILFLAVPFMHRMVRKDPLGFKWFVLGSCISMILCTFIFQRSVELSINARGLEGQDAVEGIVSGPLFWISRLGSALIAPAKGWYVSVPIAYSVAAPMFMAVFAMLTSASGRAAALSSLASAAFCIIGGRRSRGMKRICKNFGMICILGICFVFLAKATYSYAARSGFLGEKATAKYELQTRAGSGIINLLVGGRAEAFIGLFACWDRPMVGWGPWAMDTHGYAVDFLMKYGTDEDIVNYQLRMRDAARYGWVEQLHLIPCHSHITQFWLWYGLPGLIYWIYILFVFARHIKQDCYVVPQWFFWIACSIPGFFWHIFFSPLGTRTDMPLLVVVCLMARAYRKGKSPMAPHVYREIKKYGK